MSRAASALVPVASWTTALVGWAAADTTKSARRVSAGKRSSRPRRSLTRSFGTAGGWAGLDARSGLEHCRGELEREERVAARRLVNLRQQGTLQAHARFARAAAVPGSEARAAAPRGGSARATRAGRARRRAVEQSGLRSAQPPGGGRRS